MCSRGSGGSTTTFPTTFVLGRDGRVRGVHAGFASPAAGAFHAQTKKEISDEVEKLHDKGVI